MSIVIALGVTTPETSYSDMAAGSDPESVEASPAVNEKTYSNHSCGSAQSHGYRGLPYAMQQSSVVCCQDHNYGAPPPPTPPASPLSQTIIPRVELNGVARGTRYHPNHDEENSADSDSSSEEDGGVASWCHCSLTQDGFLIKCESCSFRGLDRWKGVEGQRRKPENVSVGESSATESGDEEVSPATVSYTATQHTPTSITLTVNRVKRNKSKKRKKSTEKARGAPKGKKVKAFREGSRKSMRMKNSTTEASQVDENTAEGWESKIRQWTDQYEEALANQYSADVQTLLQLHRAANTTVTNATAEAENESVTRSPQGQVRASADMMDTINRTELACNNTVLGSQMQLGRVTRVQKHRKILRASKDLQPDTLIIEYRGKVMLKQQFEVNGHFFKKPYPFILFYSKFNEVEMCVDARTFGNDARFIRRSCTPNAEVRHMIAEGMIHLCIYAVTQITKDAEVTIGFDYEFNSCNYKVDCACQKGNQNCPVQKHNLSPRENLLFPPALPPPSSLAGAETRRRKARRKEMEGGVGPGATSDDSNLPPEETGEAQDVRGGSDPEEGLVYGVKQEEGLEGELDENGLLMSSRRTREERKAEAIMHVFENLDKRKRRATQGGASTGGGAEEAKQEGSPSEEGAVNPSGGNPAPHSTGMGVSTRRTTYVSEPTVELDKTLASTPTSSAGAPNLPAPSKPPPSRSTKPRPKSRISRYRSSSSQRARRQRQALAQQQAAAEQGGGAAEEGPQGPVGAEPGPGDAGATAGHTLDGDLSSTLNKGNLRYPKTKKYLVTEWLNDKVPDKASQEAPGVAERPLRITSDPTVLATTLNMLPGLSQPPLICTAPKHYVRFGSPFNPERHRPRPLKLDGTYGCYKKRWIQQAQDESCSASLEDGTESTSSHQSNSSSSTPNPPFTELAAPIKKRRAKYASEASATPIEHLLPPLSPVTPPPPSDPLLSASCAALLLGMHPHHHHYPGDEEEGVHRPNSLACSPLPSLPTSRCNTPLQFENISSPEASPLHRPESISPEPCLRTDFDLGRPQFPDLSLSSCMESPVPLGPDDFSLLAGAAPPESQGPASVEEGSHTPTQATPPDAGPSREQAFRTEFNLIYTCSPLNANLGNPTTDRRLSQSEGSFSPAESFYGTVGGQGLQVEAGLGSMSPYGEPNYGGGYPDSDTPPHTSNPPQKKKATSLHTISLLTDKPDYQALAVRSEYKPVQNMVSLLEYRKRKQGSGRDSEPGGGGSNLGTPTRPGSMGPGRAESPGMISRPPHHHHHSQHHHPHLQPPTSSSSSPHSSFSSPAHPSSSIAQIEEVSPPPDHHQNSSQASGQQHQGNSHWMVPTSVERLRESHGVLERVLRGGLKMERTAKRLGGADADKDPDADRYELQTMGRASPMKSPHRYSPSVYTHQPSSSENHHQTDSPVLLQTSTASSPFRGSYSPSAAPPSGQGFYSRLSSHIDPSQQPHNPPSSYPNQTTSADSAQCGTSRTPGGALHQQSSSSNMDVSNRYSGSHLKASLLSSGLSPTPGSRAHGIPKTDSGAAASVGVQATHASRLNQQQQAPRSLKPGSPGQAGLQVGSRLLQASGGQHYPQRGPALSQFQHPPIQGSGVRTQSGSF
ncbi:histone-lysine N-methyltransferase SETD5 isoform X3 [Osmerus eperlanus]|uniref:histone-lysine N-methyltransferase SETD5 isoform X3 n=1 Tax=Osmerus eperlanus TaxID=29151 RepID=UPI002E0D7B53